MFLWWRNRSTDWTESIFSQRQGTMKKSTFYMSTMMMMAIDLASPCSENQCRHCVSSCIGLCQVFTQPRKMMQTRFRKVCQILTLPRKMMQIKLIQAAVTEVIVDDHWLIWSCFTPYNSADTVIRYTITPNTAAKTINNCNRVRIQNTQEIKRTLFN